MNRYSLVALAVATSIAAFSGSTFSKGKPPSIGEAAANNISFPVILSENLGPGAFPADGAWRFADILDPTTECIGEEGVEGGEPVPQDIVCYYGRKVTVVSETGEIVFTGEPKIWWLQQRTANFWKALTLGHDTTTDLVVSAVDIGDLLESSPAIQARMIRTEFNLLQNVPTDDPEFGQYVVTDWTTGIPDPCIIPTTAEHMGCFAALGMSGAVPGTEQSGNETQGTDFNGTQVLLDPTTVRGAVAEGGVAIPIHSQVYSYCARLVIQQIAGDPVWDPTVGYWTGPGVGNPVVNIAAYDGMYTVEVNSGGGIVYGYNWNAKTAATGDYRLTFVLDGNDEEGPACPVQLATVFDSAGTSLVNVGESNKPGILYAGDSQLGDEGGLVYLDLALTPKGGGGGGGKNHSH